MTIIGIVGSRGFTNYEEFCEVLAPLLPEPPVSFVSGGARGADALAERYAEEHGIPILVLPADWTRYGKSAGPIRNKLIVQKSDFIVAFWDGKSRGTKSSIELAEQLGIRCIVHRFV